MSNSKNNALVLSWICIAGLSGCAVTSEGPVSGEPTDEGPVPQTKGGGCVSLTQGGDTSCKPTYLWKQYANDDCVARGQVLGSFSTSVACDKSDGHRYAKYTCCPQSGPGAACDHQAQCNPYGSKCCATDATHTAGTCGAVGIGCAFGDFGP